MKLLYGAPISEKILSALKAEISREEEKPGLAVVLIGENKASKIYVGLKERRAKEIGMNFFLHKFSKQVSENEILTCIRQLNEDDKIHGIIVQLPLPEGFDAGKIISSLDPKKDVDGFHPENAGKFLQGKSEIFPVFPHAILRLLESGGQDLSGKKAVVIANSEEFGKIMQATLQRKGMRSEIILAGDVPGKLRQIKEADVVVSAVGLPGLLRGEMVKDGAIIIDGGIEKVGEKVVGDADFASFEGKDCFLSPVPGGVGPVTIAALLKNTFLAFNRQKNQ